MLIIETPWQTSPPHTLRILPEFSAGAYLLRGIDYLRNEATGRSFVSTNLSRTTGLYDVAQTTESSSSKLNFGNTADLNPGLAGYTLGMLAYIRAPYASYLTTRYFHKDIRANYEANNSFGFNAGRTDYSPPVYFSATSYVNTTPNSVQTLLSNVTGAWRYFVMTHDGGRLRLYISGVLIGSVACALPNASTFPLLLGADLNSNNTSGNFSVEMAYYLRYCLPGSLVQSPWQIFTPQQIIIPTPAAAGYTHPTLSLATATEITATSFKPRVTYTFA